MYNTEILEKIVDEFGKEKATEFCNIVSVMYDIKYNACKNKRGLCEYDHERDWWNNAYVELKKDEQS